MTSAAISTQLSLQSLGPNYRLNRDIADSARANPRSLSHYGSYEYGAMSKQLAWMTGQAV